MPTVAGHPPLARFIRRRREKLRLRVVDVARKMGVSSPTVCNWETGKAQPGVARLPRLASLLEVEVHELVKRAA